MLTPEQLAQPNTEHAHQSALFCWIATAGAHVWPELSWAHAIPNGGARDVPTAGRLKAEGVKAGVFDIFVPVAMGRYHGMYCEMKKPGRQKDSNGGVSDIQKKFGLAMHSRGYHTVVCYNWLEARDEICKYMQLGPFGI